jgi:transposase-like protein
MICPRCKKNELNPVEVRNALSRRDNKTYICSDCGTDEAMFDFAARSKPEALKKKLYAQESAWLNGGSK